MRLKEYSMLVVLVMWVCLPANVNAQTANSGGQQGQSATVGAVGQDAQGAEEQAAPQAVDPRSFSGAGSSTVRPFGSLHGYFFPSFQFSETADSNFEFASGTQRFESISTIMGRLDYQQVQRHSVTTIEFMGGGSVYYNHSEFNSTSEQFGISHSYTGRRWSFMFDDRASYLPESPFGYGGFGFTGSLGEELGGATGSNLSNINSSFSSSPSLLTGRGPRIFNSTTLQAQYKLGARSALTMSANFGLLHFRTPGFIDSRSGYAMAGFNHSFTARDSVGISYGYSIFRYRHLAQGLYTQVLQLTYGRRISGRMSLHFGAGPQYMIIHNPISGSDSTSSWAASSSLDYQYHRQALSIMYDRGTNNGGGVLIGSISDDVRAAWSTGFARHWSWSFSPGYAHNRNIDQTTAMGGGVTFNTEYVGVSISRRFGRNTSMFVNYNFQNQRANSQVCATGVCTSGLHRNIFGFGFDFHPRQISAD